MTWYEFAIIQGVFIIVMYFISRTLNKRERTKSRQQTAVISDSKDAEELARLRKRHLTVPLGEMSRPDNMSGIIGQEDGIRALRAALCGKNPQHVIIYGPPGVGKTCAARLVLEEAKRKKDSPFDKDSMFVEIDATCVRFDERSIADPLLGSVHDPIYQGAGALGTHGIPQPRAGAVTKAHCGVLFLDEIGELHPIQMNKLLKVLEDRCVHLESAYYSPGNKTIPPHIHDIFQNGLPADFRLIGATTRRPEELPSALRSRCVEIFFSALSDDSIMKIATTAAAKMNVKISKEAVSCCSDYASSGREAVSMIQLAAGVAFDDGRTSICSSDIEWVAKTCRHSRKYKSKLPDITPAGVCYGLGVSGETGAIMEIECSVERNGSGKIDVRGAIKTETIEVGNRQLTRDSMVYTSAKNVVTAFGKRLGIDCGKYDIEYNITSGIPVDGPSAGVAFAVSLMSALTGRAVKNGLTLTGEITMNGEVRPVGGVKEKIEAAAISGARCVIIPKENIADSSDSRIKTVTVSSLNELMKAAFSTPTARYKHENETVVSAKTVNE